MRRLPGVSVVDLPGAAGEGLPPMDIPVFVGFAERGPLQRPIALADASQYEAVFGRRFDLLTTADGRTVPAHLPAAVQAFFAGGGRRCYVVRVAGAGAATARWRVSGLRIARRGDSGWALAPAEAGPWLAAGSKGSWADRLQVSARLQGETLQEASPVAPGDLLRVHVPGTDIEGFLRVCAQGTAGAAAAAGPVLWTVAPPSPPKALGIERLAVDLALREPAQPERGLAARLWQRTGCGLAAGAATLPWTEPDATARLDRHGEALVAEDAWPLAGDASLAGDGWMLVPDGLGPAFDTWAGAEPEPVDALQRNGLATFDAKLFLDASWESDLRGPALLAWADQLRYFTAGAPPRRLTGLHAALGWRDEPVREATWIAAPDAVHVGWSAEPLEEPFEATLTLAPHVQAARDPLRFGDCVQPPPGPPAAPHWHWKEAPQRPRVSAGVPWPLLLQPAAESPPSSPSPPSPAAAPTRLEVQIASAADFSDPRPLAATLWDEERTIAATAWTEDRTVAVPGALRVVLPVGLHFLRARTLEVRGARTLASAWSEVMPLVAHAAARTLNAVPAADRASVVATVHSALLDVAAATREHVALLSVPQDWGAAEIASHIKLLREPERRRDEQAQSESFAVLHHPWVQQALPLAAFAEPAAATARALDALGARADASLTEAHPPEGALMAQYAQRTRQRGAWSAAGLDPLVWAVAVAGSADPAGLEAAGANAIEMRIRGVAATRAWTLATDSDWQSLGVRRLFILLRALARREGERFAFEPNDAALRRSLERGFDSVLSRLMQRGAFRGARASEAYALRTASGRELMLEIEGGQCSLEIRVAPSRPMRFLKLTAIRSGEQWRIEEGG